MMEVYVLVKDDTWEDIVIYLSYDEAIKASVANKDYRIEIFRQRQNGYVPTYNFISNGVFYNRN